MSIFNPFTWGKKLTSSEKKYIDKVVRDNYSRFGGNESLSSVYRNHVISGDSFKLTRHGHVRRFMMEQYPQGRKERLNFKRNTSPLLGRIFGGGSGGSGSGGGSPDEPPESQSSDVPNYKDEEWEMLKDEVGDIMRDIHGFGPNRIEYVTEEISRVQYGVKDRVDLRKMAKQGGSKRELADNVVPILEEWDVPYTSPYGTIDKGEKALEKIAGPVSASEGGIAYMLGRVWGYARYWIVIALFFVSGAMTLGSLAGGISELTTLSGMFWLVLFIASGYYWYEQLGLYLPLPHRVREEKPSDQFLLGLEAVFVLWALLLWTTGSVPLLGPLGLDSIQLSTVLLLLGLAGAYGLYHGEATVEEIRSGAGRVSGRVKGAVNRGGTGEDYERSGAGDEALEDMIETARDRAMRLHSEERIDDDQFEAIETDITEAEMHLDRGRTKDAERKVNHALEQINELEVG